jgi:hypothetical protein
MRVLIVSKTHMNENACIGGLTEDNRSVRLLTENGGNHPQDTNINIGDIWEMTLQKQPNAKPPHVEDEKI